MVQQSDQYMEGEPIPRNRSFNMFRSLALTHYSFLFGSGNPDCSSEESRRTKETDGSGQSDGGDAAGGTQGRN